MSKKIIRLRRKGVRYSPIYDIVVTYQKKRAKGPFIEKLGFFNPKPPKILFINNQKMGFWLNKGAKLHSTLRKYLINLVAN